MDIPDTPLTYGETQPITPTYYGIYCIDCDSFPKMNRDNWYADWISRHRGHKKSYDDLPEEPKEAGDK